MARLAAPRLFVLSLATLATTGSVRAQCPEEPLVTNGTGAGQVTCPCFVPGEEAGAVFNLPASEFPLEILRIQIGWGSQLGGQPDALEQAIHIYPAGLPNPGTPQLTISGPVLSDGFINEFTLPIPEQIDSGPFSVTLEFANTSSLFGPSVVHDGNGCASGKNLVKALPGGWQNACGLGVTGDWVFNVVYRKVDCGGTTPTQYCVGKLSSAFCLADITTSDPLNAPVSGAADYSVIADDVQAFRNGILFFSLSGQFNIPFQGGTLCVSPPLARGPLMNSGGSAPGACDGQFTLLLNDGASLWDTGPGNMVWAQAWFRDPPVDIFGTALSNGIEITYQ